MTAQENIFFALIRSELSQQKLTEQEKKLLFSQISKHDWENLMKLSAKHMMAPLLFESMQNNQIDCSEMVGHYFQQSAFHTSMCYYRFVSLTAELFELFGQEKITCYLLKGASLSVWYPKEEIRSFGDIDIYVPDRKQFERACQILEKNGHQKREDLSDYHVSYDYRGGSAQCEVEMHWKLATAFEPEFDRRLQQVYTDGLKEQMITYVYPLGIKVPVLPDTLNAVYLLQHMFQHFMAAGFGVKLFCDWTAFWNREKKNVDESCFLEAVKSLHLEGFLYAVTGVCQKYFGLRRERCTWYREEKVSDELIDELLLDVLDGGEFGKSDEARMLITTQKPGFRTNLHELHRQMKKRFPKKSHYQILWPILWFATGAIFMYNNKTIRKVSTKEILSSNQKRNRLAKQLGIFEK